MLVLSIRDQLIRGKKYSFLRDSEYFFLCQQNRIYIQSTYIVKNDDFVSMKLYKYLTKSSSFTKIYYIGNVIVGRKIVDSRFSSEKRSFVQKIQL